MDILFLIIGLVVGAGAMWFVMKAKIDSQDTDKGAFTQQDYQLLAQEKARIEERANLATKDITEVKLDLQQARDENIDLTRRLEKSIAVFQGQETRMAEQKEELEQLNAKFQKEFENIASKVLRQNSEQINQLSNEKLTLTLKPLGERIKSFEEKIERSGKDQEGLKEQIKLLHDLNKRMADEAQNLTKALKGDAKKQGNWGEVILERVLERSGLVKGQEYDTQYSTQNLEGKLIQPDVIVRLPENKHLIIDAKVSLVAYEQVINAESEDERGAALKSHVISVKSHVKKRSEKAYQTSVGLNTPDFVLLFIPIESSFSLAIQADIDLFNFAWDNKVVIVSPSTLLATLRTISSIWNQERQTKNAIEIARQSGALYDKFVGFLSDMEKINKGLLVSQKSYDDAINKLSTGTGNLITRAEKIKLLGAKATKEIDETLIERSENQFLSKEHKEDNDE